ncbi:MAG: hypothetical protein LBH93_08530, partial [Chitinispirillales bacterium]|nr:hypothetical protein [Chitinispirillales bacterium]
MPLSSSVLIIFVLTALNAGAQHFPEELTFPRANIEDADSGGEDAGHAANDDKSDSSHALNVSIDQSLFDKSYTGINNIAYSRALGPLSLTQNLWYELRRDKLQNTRHYLSAAGSLEYALENARYSWITPGLDWSPVVQHSSDRGGSNALMTFDIGPLANFSVKGVPVTLRTGISGRRVDSLASALSLGDNRQSVGAYGAFAAGSEEELLPFAPFYFYADGLGRQIENSSMTSITSSALGALQIGERDSLLVYGAASLFNGREGYLEGSADSRAALFTETPWRVERNVAAT